MLNIVTKLKNYVTEKTNSPSAESIVVMDKIDFLKLHDESSIENTKVHLFSHDGTYIESRPVYNEDNGDSDTSYYYANMKEGRVRYSASSEFFNKIIDKSKNKKNSRIMKTFSDTYKKAINVLNKNRRDILSLITHIHDETKLSFEELYVCVKFDNGMTVGVPSINPRTSLYETISDMERPHVDRDFKKDKILL